MSRATVFLSVLSASTIALALLADATGFGPQTSTLALVLLPVVLFLGIAAHGRLVEINREEVERSLAMNRLRHAYLKNARPEALLHHRPPRRRVGASSWSTRRRSSRRRSCGCDRRARGAGRWRPSRRSPWWPGTVAFLVVWAALLLQQRRALDPLRRTTPRFPTPPDEA